MTSISVLGGCVASGSSVNAYAVRRDTAKAGASTVVIVCMFLIVPRHEILFKRIYGDVA